MASNAQKERWRAEQRAKNEAREVTVPMPRKPTGNPNGRPKGVRVTMATRERIRGAHLINRLEAFVDGEQHEPSQVTAALGLLKFQLPTLQATDITSGGEPLTVERTVFGVKRE